MPWGAIRLKDNSALTALKTAVQLDNTSPTGLVWRADYGAKKASPGAPAGSFDPRLNQCIVTVKGFPLYSRHAVWMLANDQPIPEGMDITAVDGNLSNLDPANLTTIAKADRARAINAQVSAAAADASLTRDCMVRDFVITHTPYGCGFNVYLRGHLFSIENGMSHEQAVYCAFRVGMEVLYIRTIPLALPPELERLVVGRLRACDPAIVEKKDRTPSMNKIVAKYQARLDEELAKLRAEQNGKKQAVAS